MSTDADTGQTIISGMGELHLDIYVERMRREYKVRARAGGALFCFCCRSSAGCGTSGCETDIMWVVRWMLRWESHG